MSEFYRSKQAKDSLHSWCKTCVRVTQKIYSDKNKTKKAASDKEYSDKNKDKIAKWNRTRAIRDRFGITVKKYDQVKQELFEKQDGCCAMCGAHDSYYNCGLSLDHNHDTGQIRELLCVVCNTKLAYIEDIEFVVKAKAYPAKHK